VGGMPGTLLNESWTKSAQANYLLEVSKQDINGRW